MQQVINALIEDLNNSQYKSDNSQEYEKVLGRAFEFLGYDVEVIGGSGDTDVLLTANLGANSYKVDVDAKTSKNGKISDAQINWPSLNDHKKKNGSEFIVVVGPNFAGGNLEKRANEFQVALLPNEGLTRLLTTHSTFPFSLNELRDLFSGTGDISSQVDDLISQNLSKRRILVHLSSIMGEMEALQDRLGYFTFDSLAGREKIESLDIDPTDIEQIIELFKLPFINAVQPINSDQNQLILTLRQKEFSNLFSTISSLILQTNKQASTINEQVGQTVIESKKTLITDKGLGTKYFEWGKDQKGKSIIAKARPEEPYLHYCPIEHFSTILDYVISSYNSNNVINVSLLESILLDKELAPNRKYKGAAEKYKLFMVLGILEIEAFIKWTGTKRPIEYKLAATIEEIKKWKTEYFPNT